MNRSQRQRRNRNNRPSSLVSTATKAFAAYGAYKLASFAWKKFIQTGDNDSSSSCNETYSTNQNQDQDHNQQYRDHQRQRHTSKAIARRRQQQLAKCNRETIATIDTFLNKFKSSIEALTDYSLQTKSLKQMRAGSGTSGDVGTCSIEEGSVHSHSHSHNHSFSKQELWDDIKTKSITRMISTAYAHSILVLLLTVQIHLLGGKIFRDQLERESERNNTTRTDASNNTNSDTHTSDHANDHANEEGVSKGLEECQYDGSYHKQVLVKTLEYFFQGGLESLVSDVQKVVKAKVSDWRVMNENDQSVGSITLEDFDGGVESIRRELDNVSFTQYICAFDMHASTSACGDGDIDDSLQSEEVRFILDETLDILDSPVFKCAKKDVLFMTFDILRGRGYGLLFGGAQDQAQDAEAQPLVTVVTKLKKVCNSFYASPDETNEDRWVDRPMSSYPSIYLFHLDRMNSVRELGDVSFT